MDTVQRFPHGDQLPREIVNQLKPELSMLAKFFARVVLDVYGWPSQRCFSRKSFSPADVQGKLGILGVPFGKGQKKKGKEEAGLKIAPDVLRETGFCEVLKNIGMDISDYGNILYEPHCDLSHPNMHNLDHVAPCTKMVSNNVENILRDNRSCLVLGGDHSIAVGSISGHLSVTDPKKVALIYVDAHADINTNKTSPSGNVHGMTVALLAQELQCQWPESGVPGMDWLSPSLLLRNVAYIGLRSVDSGEARTLCENDVAVFGMEDVTLDGIHTVLCKALARIDPTGCKSIHVSFDIDALDYNEAPCTTVPVRGGLTLREGIEIAEFLHQTGRLSVVDLVEVSPALGNESQKQLTLDAAKHIILSMYGYSRRGNLKKERRD